jgi:hypothetical protein
MHRVLAARAAACWLIVLVTLGGTRAAGAQAWNDPRTRELVEQATSRRVQQLADPGLTDYQATAHGYVTFLAQLGEGFPTPPKVIKADELELQVYWHAPNQSKQIIVGRRDTLLLPTDINYHRDHLGIAQNNFPSVIRIGDGDEVADVPHPLSIAGLRDYDFALADSFAIGAGTQRIRVYEIKVRPKDDKQPRVVGAIYLDPAEQQVVRMNLTFTRAALLDKSLEDLSIVLENRLVAGKYWLPSRQELEIRRSGTWLDYPVRGIIRGRWEIGDYKFDLGLPPPLFVGPEIVQAAPSELAKYPWTGKILDSLPSDTRAVEDADVTRVREEARALVRAQALARPQTIALSARDVSDFVRFNRVEGLALGDGIAQHFGDGFAGVVRARYGIDDRDVKGSAALSWTSPSGFALRLFGLRDTRDVGDQQERSTVVNSLAAQEYASDYTDPYLVRGGGVGLDVTNLLDMRWTLDASVERQSPLAVHADPVTGTFAPPPDVLDGRVARLDLRADRAAALWLGGTELSASADARWTTGLGSAAMAGLWSGVQTWRGSALADVERPVGNERFVSRTTAAGVWSSGAFYPQQELVFLGGPVSAPGYDYHSLVSHAAAGEHLEWQFPVPFIPFSLGRFGRVPSEATLAPYVHDVWSAGAGCEDIPVPDAFQGVPPRRVCDDAQRGFHPSVGVGFLSPFDLLRLDVAKGVGRGGQWIFSIDVGREFWSIL